MATNNKRIFTSLDGRHPHCYGGLETHVNDGNNVVTKSIHDFLHHYRIGVW